MTADDKAHVRGQLDLAGVVWRRAPAAEGEHAIEVGVAVHVNGSRYVVMRSTEDLDFVHVFTTAEWRKFMEGAKNGLFDDPW